MNKITSIEPQKKHKGRFNIYLDYEFALGLSEEIIVREELKEGQNLTKEKISELLFKDQGAKAYLKALRFLHFRMRSEQEMRKKLKEKEFDPQIIEKTIKRLKKENLINDQEFCRMWIRNRIALRPSGSYILHQELRQKGISDEVISKILKEFFKKDEEFNLALLAAEKKKESWKGLSRLEFSKKMAGFLARRGFSWEIIKRILDKFKKEN